MWGSYSPVILATQGVWRFSGPRPIPSLSPTPLTRRTRLARWVLLVFGQRGLALGFSLAGLEERAKCGLALAGRLFAPGWGFVRALGERARPPVFPSPLWGPRCRLARCAFPRQVVGREAELRPQQWEVVSVELGGAVSRVGAGAGFCGAGFAGGSSGVSMNTSRTRGSLSRSNTAAPSGSGVATSGVVSRAGAGTGFCGAGSSGGSSGAGNSFRPPAGEGVGVEPGRSLGGRPGFSSGSLEAWSDFRPPPSVPPACSVTGYLAKLPAPMIAPAWSLLISPRAASR